MHLVIVPCSCTGFAAQKGRPSCLEERPQRVSTKWLCTFVEFAFFTVSEADGREKWKEWFRLWPKPPRPTGIAGRYESSQRGAMPLRHLLIGFVDSLRPPFLPGRAASFFFFTSAGAQSHPHKRWWKLRSTRSSCSTSLRFPWWTAARSAGLP